MALTNQFRLDPGLLHLLVELGISPNDFLKQAGLSSELFSLESANLGVEDYFRFWTTLELQLDSNEAPFLIGRVVNIGMFNAPILAALASSNLVSCFERLSRFKPLIGPLVLSLETTQDGTWVELNTRVGNFPVPRLLLATEAVFHVQLVRMATKKKISPVVIESPATFAASQSRQFFGTSPKISERQRILFSAEDSILPFLTGNESLWQFYEDALQKQLKILSKEKSFLARVQTTIFDLLPSGYCGIEGVASRLNVSVRTLQRNLSQDGTTFQQELSRSRELMAKHYLSRSGLSGVEIAYLLAYDDPNSFPRAFHQWTGSTPEMYRKSTSINA